MNKKEIEIKEYSNPTRVYQNAIKYLGPKVNIQLSTQPTKKYMVYNPIDDIWVHFGRMGYEDYTKHLNLERRHNYLVRSAGIKGDWKRDKYSANMLSRQILWEA